MADTKKFQRLRKQFWKENPCCRNCGIETILPNRLMHFYGCISQRDRESKFQKIVKREDLDRMATIQHLYDRLDPRRHVKPAPNEVMYSRFELWCHKCNQEDSEKRMKEMPIEELRKRSRRGRLTGE